MINLTYHRYSPNNWGDFIAPVIVKYITGQDSNYLPENNNFVGDNYAIVGSILGWLTNPTVKIWGVGFISENSTLRTTSKNIYAVRGKLSRSILLKQNIKCPEVYGDPVLLLPKFYKPNITKKYKLGIIPHYIDKNNIWLRNIKSNEVKIIDICGESLGVINQVLECEKIISSSLHGLVLADAYNIPNMWIELSDDVGGKGFKFKDYFSSINKPVFNVRVIKDTTIENLLNLIKPFEIQIDLDILLKNCPLIKV